MPFKKGEIPKGAKPFKKGQSGNPNGRPKLPDLKATIAKVLGEEQNGMTALEVMTMALRKKAMNGDVRAYQELLNRGFGKPQERIDLTTDGEALPKPEIKVYNAAPPLPSSENEIED